MVKILFWIIGLIVGVPILFVAWVAFWLFVFYPAKHSWNVKRMDAKNDQVWEEAIARVVTVEVELGTSEGIETLKSDIICYEGYYARPWTLKGGAPTSGMTRKSIGFEALQADFPTGATLDIDIRFLCNKAFRVDTEELPLKLEFSRMYIVAPVRSLYCSFPAFFPRSDTYVLHTDAGWVGYPHIVAYETRPLRTFATRSDMGTSDTSLINSGFSRRWGAGFRRSNWRDDRACWGDKVGRCDKVMTHYCGENPR